MSVTASARRGLGAGLPDFPWDTLATARATANAYPGGVVDLSIGTPVDPTPEVAQRALAAGSDSPGYPLTSGTPALRQALADYVGRRWGAAVLPEATLPLIGSKELVAWLPTLLGLGPDDVVVYPEAAYPTYAAGVQVAGARGVACDDLTGSTPRASGPRWSGSTRPPTPRVRCWRRRCWPSGSPGPARTARSWRRTSATGSSAGRPTRLRAAPRRVGGQPRRAARRVLAVQAVQPGRLPGRVPGR